MGRVVKPSRRSRIAWHYSKVFHLLRILNAEILNTTCAWDGREKPALWFTTSPDFEPTASPGDEVLYSTGGAMRFGYFANRLRTYDEWVRRCGLPRDVVELLERTAVDMGSNPRRDWLVSFHPIPVRACRFEVKTTAEGEWSDLNPWAFAYYLAKRTVEEGGRAA